MLLQAVNFYRLPPDKENPVLVYLANFFSVLKNKRASTQLHFVVGLHSQFFSGVLVIMNNK